MARSRKKIYDPRQLMFNFEVTADHIEQLRRETLTLTIWRFPMLDRQTAPLEIARTVLRPETIRSVRTEGYTNSAYLILDRWALNQPDELRRLEAMGPIDFMLVLSQQQQLEKSVLTSDSGWEASRQGMSDWEILQNAGVDMSLKITL